MAEMKDVKKDISLVKDGYGVNTYIFTIAEDNVNEKAIGEFKIYQNIDFNTAIGIVNSVYSSMTSNIEIMYAIRQPLVCYHIMNLLTNVDVSDVVDDEDNIDMNKAFALSISSYGNLIYNMGKNGTYNIVSVINQLLDKKLEELNRFLDSNTPANKMFNEATQSIEKFNSVLDSVSESIKNVDDKAISKQLLKFTPKAMVDAYLNSAFSKNKTNEILDAKNEEIRDLKEKLNNVTARNVKAGNVVKMSKKTVSKDNKKAE